MQERHAREESGLVRREQDPAKGQENVHIVFAVCNYRDDDGRDVGTLRPVTIVAPSRSRADRQPQLTDRIVIGRRAFIVHNICSIFFHAVAVGLMCIIV